MTTGLWALGHPAPSENGIGTLTHPPATLSDATSIHSLTLYFTPNPNRDSDDITPFIRLGQISYSPNYFIVPFPNLVRVEMGFLTAPPYPEPIVPFPHLFDVETGFLTPPPHPRLIFLPGSFFEKLGDAIKLLDSRLGVRGKLTCVAAYHGLIHNEQDPRFDWFQRFSSLLSNDYPLLLRDRWFWEAREGEVLGRGRIVRS